MNAGRVHAIIAAGLANPQMLERWRQQPGLLRGYGVDPAEFDLDALWKAAGIAVKVRHNGLRGDLPLTFRLLNVTGLEIEVFASYASERRGRYSDSVGARASDFLTFLGHWLDPNRREHAILWDLTRHEWALAQLSRAAPPAPDATQFSWSELDAASVPCLRGEVTLHVMRSDPRAVAAELHERSPQLHEVALANYRFCYWRVGEEPEIQILELDELGFYLLSLVDGRNSTGELSRKLGGGSRPGRALLRAIGELAAMGILTFDAKPKESADAGSSG